ncbi:DNA-dependent RNA polymerase beta' subunit/160 kD subunit, partial [Giardia duodenalis]
VDTTAGIMQVDKGISKVPYKGKYQPLRNRLMSFSVISDQLLKVSAAAVHDNKSRIAIPNYLAAVENIRIRGVWKSD